MFSGTSKSIWKFQLIQARCQSKNSSFIILKCMMLITITSWMAVNSLSHWFIGMVSMSTSPHFIACLSLSDWVFTVTVNKDCDDFCFLLLFLTNNIVFANGWLESDWFCLCSPVWKANSLFVRCEVFMVMMQVVIWVVMLCSDVVGYQCFGGLCCLHFWVEVKVDAVRSSKTLVILPQHYMASHLKGLQLENSLFIYK
jgi:hypothetical protein